MNTSYILYILSVVSADFPEYPLLVTPYSTFSESRNAPSTKHEGILLQVSISQHKSSKIFLRNRPSGDPSLVRFATRVAPTGG